MRVMRIERGVVCLVKFYIFFVVVVVGDGNVEGLCICIFLSSLDLVVLMVYVEVIYVFELSVFMVVLLLEEFLWKVLVEYCEWVGRFGRDVVILWFVIEFIDDGVVFMEVVVDGFL